MKSHFPTRDVILADVLGLAVLAIQLVCLFRWLMHDDGTRTITGFLVYIALAAIALGLWHREKMAQKLSVPGDWARLAGASLVLGGLSFGIDMLIGLVFNSELSPISAGAKAGGPFGFVLTVFLCPGLTVVAVAGLVRSFLSPKQVTQI